MIHVCFLLSPIPVPLRRVVHALQQQKIAPFMYGLLSVFLYSVGPSRIDQVIQCDLLHVTAYVTTRAPILLLFTPTLKKRSESFLPSDMMHVHFATRKVARPKMSISKRR